MTSISLQPPGFGTTSVLIPPKMYPLLGLYMFDRFQRQNRLKLQLLAKLANRIPQEEPKFNEPLFDIDI
jgi:hypothetical protein